MRVGPTPGSASRRSAIFARSANLGGCAITSSISTPPAFSARFNSARAKRTAFAWARFSSCTVGTAVQEGAARSDKAPPSWSPRQKWWPSLASSRWVLLTEPTYEPNTSHGARLVGRGILGQRTGGGYHRSTPGRRCASRVTNDKQGFIARPRAGQQMASGAMSGHGSGTSSAHLTAALTQAAPPSCSANYEGADLLQACGICLGNSQRIGPTMSRTTSSTGPGIGTTPNATSPRAAWGCVRRERGSSRTGSRGALF